MSGSPPRFPGSGGEDGIEAGTDHPAAGCLAAGKVSNRPAGGVTPWRLLRHPKWRRRRVGRPSSRARAAPPGQLRWPRGGIRGLADGGTMGNGRGRRTVRWLVTVCMLVAVAGLVTSARARSQATRQVTYHGYKVEVPTSWPVVDLARNPSACVRFDVHAVYLGHPGADPSCPARSEERRVGKECRSRWS